MPKPPCLNGEGVARVVLGSLCNVTSQEVRADAVSRKNGRRGLGTPHDRGRVSKDRPDGHHASSNGKHL
jgi:hypothetical protein